jgi:non-ribosomal peptide synthetase component F
VPDAPGPDTSGANTTAYRAALDQLLALSGDHERAVAEFRWPQLEGPFNWAVDWFDAYARGNQGTALHLVEEDGRTTRCTFDEVVRRSDQVAAWLRAHGVAKGDRVVLMLGNQVELWESMLAVMKLGAVILPTTTALGPADLVDRIARGGAAHVIANASPSGTRRPGGCPTTARTTPTTPRRRTRGRCPATRCSCTSPAARPAGPSWSSTPRSATRSGT